MIIVHLNDNYITQAIVQACVVITRKGNDLLNICLVRRRTEVPHTQRTHELEHPLLPESTHMFILPPLTPP